MNYHHPTPPEPSGFEIKTLESLEQSTNHPLSIPQIHNRFMIVWIRSGKWTHTIDTTEYEMENTLYGITPGHIHQIQAMQNTTGYIISFSADYIEGSNITDLLFGTSIFYAYPICLLQSIDEDTKTECSDIINKLIKEYNHYASLRQDIIGCFLKIILIYLTYQDAPNHPLKPVTKGTGLAKKFLALLDNHYISKKLVTDYASNMSITPSYLNDLVKKTTGMTASQHIKHRVIREAKKQAVYNGLNMKETAYLLGFDDLSHFSKYFKNATGTCFSDFRKTSAGMLRIA